MQRRSVAGLEGASEVTMLSLPATGGAKARFPTCLTLVTLLGAALMALLVATASVPLPVFLIMLAIGARVALLPVLNQRLRQGAKLQAFLVRRMDPAQLTRRRRGLSVVNSNRARTERKEGQVASLGGLQDGEMGPHGMILLLPPKVTGEARQGQPFPGKAHLVRSSKFADDLLHNL